MCILKGKRRAFFGVFLACFLLILSCCINLAYAASSFTNVFEPAYGSDGRFLWSIEAAAPDSIAISSEAELLEIANNLSGQYHLVKDIIISASNWIPFGSEEVPFTGVFDGQGFLVRGLTLFGDYEYAGLFGYVQGASVRNLGLVEANLSCSVDSSEAILGGICGYAGNSTVENCFVSGVLESKAYAENRASCGGIIGIAKNTTICKSYSDGMISADGEGGASAGGIVADSEASLVEQCINRSDVTARYFSSNFGIKSCFAGGIIGKAISGYTRYCVNAGAVNIEVDSTASSTIAYAGGICGSYAESARSPLVTDSKISHCVNYGFISGKSSCSHERGNATSYIGGIAGQSNNLISRCSNYGSIAAVSSYRLMVGGICGDLYGNTNDNAIIEYSFNAADISGSGEMYQFGLGALCGSDTNATVRDSYWCEEYEQIENSVSRSGADLRGVGNCPSNTSSGFTSLKTGELSDVAMFGEISWGQSWSEVLDSLKSNTADYHQDYEPQPPSWLDSNMYTVYPNSVAYTGQNWRDILALRQAAENLDTWSESDTTDLNALLSKGKNAKDAGVIFEAGLIHFRTQKNYSTILYALAEVESKFQRYSHQDYILHLWSWQLAGAINDLSYLIYYFPDSEFTRDETEPIVFMLDHSIVQIPDAGRPTFIGDHLMLPLAAFSGDRGIGVDVEWDQEKEEVTLRISYIEATLMVGSKEAYVNGDRFLLDEAVYFYEEPEGSSSEPKDLIMLPASFVSEHLGQKLTWLPEKRAIMMGMTFEERISNPYIKWSHAATSIFDGANRWSDPRLGYMRSIVSVSSFRRSFESAWGITDRDSLVVQVVSLLLIGHNYSFLSDAAVLDALNDNSFEALVEQSDGVDKFMLPFARELSEKWGESGIIAWDLFRMMYLVRDGYQVGYLTFDEATYLLSLGASMLQKHFSSWDEAVDNYLDGYAWWKRLDIRETGNDYHSRRSYYDKFRDQEWKEGLLYDEELWAVPVEIPDVPAMLVATSVVAEYVTSLDKVIRPAKVDAVSPSTPEDEIAEPKPLTILTIDSSVVMQGDKQLSIPPVPPQIINGRTMLPFRYLVAEVLGGEVSYDPETRRIKATVTEHEVVMYVDDVQIQIDGKRYEYGQAPVVIDGSTLVPLRAFEAILTDITWDAASQTVALCP